MSYIPSNTPITTDLTLTNDKKLILGNAAPGYGQAFFKFDSSNTLTVGQTYLSNQTDPTFQLVSSGEFDLYSNVGDPVGTGSFSPAIEMYKTGQMWLRNDSGQGTAGDRFINVKFDDGFDAGYHGTVRFDGSGDNWLQFGYDADGSSRTGSRIRGTNLTVESLSPLYLVADSVNVSSKILNQDGTALLPSYSFSSDPTMGIYRVGGNTIGVAVAGAAVFSIPTQGIELEPAHYIFADGTGPNNASYTLGDSATGFSGDPSAGNWIGMRVHDVEISRVDSTGLTLQSTHRIYNSDGTNSLPSYTFTSDPTTGLVGALGDLAITVSGSLVMDFYTGGATIYNGGALTFDTGGSAGATVLNSNAGGANTGIFFANGATNFSSGGTDIVHINSTGIALQGSSTIDMGGNKITSMADPTTDQDAATKMYVDSVAAGLDPKQSVRVASTVNIDLGTGGFLTIDTILTVDGDRVLVKDQSDPKENGIYNAHSGSWTRSADMDGTPSNEVSGGNFTYVEAGSQEGTGWVVVHDGDIVLGTDDVDWTQFSTAGGSGTVNGGVGGRFTYYPTTGDAVDDTDTLTTDGTDVSVTNNFKISTNNKLILGNSDNSWIKAATDGGGAFYIQSNSFGQAVFNVPGDFTINANATVNYEPSFELEEDGSSYLTNSSQGTDTDRTFHVVMQNGVEDGFHAVYTTARTLGGDGQISYGYDAASSVVTGTRIRGANLTIESLSPLNLVADTVIASNDFTANNNITATNTVFAGAGGAAIVIVTPNTAQSSPSIYNNGGGIGFGDGGNGFQVGDVFITNGGNAGVNFVAGNNYTNINMQATFSNEAFHPVGSAAAPSISFTGHTGDGLYWTGTGFGISAGGVAVAIDGTAKVLVDNYASTNRLWGADGKTLEFLQDTHGFFFGSSNDDNALEIIYGGNTTLYSNSGLRLILDSGASAFLFKVTGVERARITTSGIEMQSTSKIYNTDGTDSVPSYSFTGGTGTGMSRAGGGALVFSVNGIGTFFSEDTGNLKDGGPHTAFDSNIEMDSNFQIIANNSNNPTYPDIAFGNEGVGLFGSAAQAFSVATTSIERLRFTNSGIEMKNSSIILNTDGTQTNPSYSFVSAPDRGFSSLTNANTHLLTSLDGQYFMDITNRTGDGGGRPGTIGEVYMFDNVDLIVYGQINAELSGGGGANYPDINFNGDSSGMGFYYDSGIGVSISGTETLKFSSTGINMLSTSTIDMGTNKITNMGDPTSDQDAATKAYVDANAGGAPTVATVTSASYTAAGDGVILADATSNAITVNLPMASGNSGLQYFIKKTDSSANTVTIDPNASETVDGQTTYILTVQYESIIIICDGSNWFVF
jgi:hypothetical protein